MFTEYQLRQDWSQNLPKYYFDNSPLKTHFLNALSITFPEGEKFFIYSVKNYKDQITDPTQQLEISTFIKQENWHSYVHRQYNLWIARQGLPAESIEDLHIQKVANTKQRSSQRGTLCITVCMEHITSILAEWVLKHPEVLDKLDPHFRQVWVWHAIEEIEHNAVAIDVLNAIGGHRRRRRIMLLNTIDFIWGTTKNTVALLKADKQLFKWRTVRDLISLLFNFKNGIVIKVFIPWLTFMKKDFHPSQYNMSTLLTQYNKETLKNTP